MAMLLLYTINDPALREVHVVHVEVSADLKQAKIHYSCSADNAARVKKGLERARGFLRTHLAGCLQMRYVPDLSFFRDKSAEHDDRMRKLFQEIASEDETGSE